MALTNTGSLSRTAVFNYSEYKRLLVNKSQQDIDIIWAKEENIKFISGYLGQHLSPIKFGICHGSKRGKEQEWFSKYLKCEVIGTDMNPAAKQFPNTIEWDFHEVKPGWLNNVDFIYSNALDHSYDPAKAIRAWMSCVRPGGFCIVEWNVWGEGANPTDPFSSDIVQLTYAIIKWGKGTYCVREIIGTPLNPEYVVFVVIYKF